MEEKKNNVGIILSKQIGFGEAIQINFALPLDADIEEKKRLVTEHFSIFDDRVNMNNERMAKIQEDSMRELNAQKGPHAVK